ncbi:MULTISPECIES: hypothetical protein [unclassified Paraburkholderia]|uniref:hypothetical protein n=1 Tax=unclassified Paraburkholderia TaxID=2615204 RepID=UPI00160935CB|nr:MULTISPECIES: hypothetical protein [unclassified Paraburkholderia]MBB5442054.1 hypothetical protein [Paraburkholderia sp. WSM4177]MBB5482450.1 hypothetical protein [Paraburkholderia sp. WSM4180]
MPIWSIGPVESEPEVSIARWKVIEIDAGTRHFVGLDERDLTGRVSSAIVAFDHSRLCGRTLSGRVYRLIGNPGQADNVDYVWQQWCIVNEVASFSDVTPQLLVGAGDDPGA